MFQIGEFAQIAQVSTRQLRHYDQLGLLRPDQTDSRTGYRYYTVRQLPVLNRILALMGLGLTLEQIGPLLKDRISTADLRGMLVKRRVEVELSLEQEEMRLRHIESRIEQIEQEGKLSDYDVVIKTIEQTPFLAARCICDGMNEALALVQFVSREGQRQIPPGIRDRLVVVARNDLDHEQLDLEIGFTLKVRKNLDLKLSEGVSLHSSELPAVDAMATIVRSGPPYESHKAFGGIGIWMEANRCTVAGPCREVFLEPLTDPPKPDGALVEIQFPVRPAA